MISFLPTSLRLGWLALVLLATAPRFEANPFFLDRRGE